MMVMVTHAPLLWEKKYAEAGKFLAHEPKENIEEK